MLEKRKRTGRKKGTEQKLSEDGGAPWSTGNINMTGSWGTGQTYRSVVRRRR